MIATKSATVTALAIRRRKYRLVVIDGKDGSGKSTLSEALSHRLRVQAVHLDSFLRRRHAPISKKARLTALKQTVLCNLPCIVEGVLILEVLKTIHIKYDAIVYVKVMNGDHWVHETELIPCKSLTQHLADLYADALAFAQILGEPHALGLADDVIRYHNKFKPYAKALIEYRRPVATMTRRRIVRMRRLR